MANINITIPDAVISEVVDAFANKFGWTSETGMTKNQFAKSKVAEYIKSIYIEDKDRITSKARADAAEVIRQSELSVLNQVAIN
jgi:hypothetical protein